MDDAQGEKVRRHTTRHSAQSLVQAHNHRVKKSQSKKEASKASSPCSIVITEAEEDKAADETDRNANRLSIASNSSVESSRSENNCEENAESGSSVFYVVWD